MDLELDHIVLNTTDVAGMLDFYIRVVGLAPERVDAYRAGSVKFPSLRITARTIIDLFPPGMRADGDTVRGAPNLNHFCLSMPRAEWTALRERLSANGTGIDTGPVGRWGAMGEGVSVYFRDPDGNTVEARYYG